MALALFTSAQAQKASFDKKGYQFNDVVEGDTLKFNYYFTNTGSQDLVLKKVKPTCGCTGVVFPREAIAPGSRDSIQVVFVTNDRVGYNAKGVNVESNGGPVSLVFEAQVIAREPKLEEQIPVNNEGN